MAAVAVTVGNSGRAAAYPSIEVLQTIAIMEEYAAHHCLLIKRLSLVILSVAQTARDQFLFRLAISVPDFSRQLVALAVANHLIAAMGWADHPKAAAWWKMDCWIAAMGWANRPKAAFLLIMGQIAHYHTGKD